MIPDLQTALFDLLQALEGKDIQLIIGGGFGIYLKADYIRRLSLRTLFQACPEPRATIDLDLFLRPELLIHPAKLKPLAEALASLGYQVVPGAEKYQFIKPGPGGIRAGSIKIDILTGPQSCFVGSKVKTNGRRAKPYPSVGLHAHPVDEIPTLEIGLLSISLQRGHSSGDFWKAEVFLPHPYTFLMMKLFAFRDRLDDADKDFGRYHALDLYTILATTTELEWTQARAIRDQNAKEPYIAEAGNLVSKYFSELNRIGMIRLRESPYYRPELQIDEFMSALKELFPNR
jgi:hypothetical protein